MARLVWTRIVEWLRRCEFMRAVRMDGNKCLSIRKAAWLTARSSEAGGAATGAMATTAGAGDGKGKSGRDKSWPVQFDEFCRASLGCPTRVVRPPQADRSVRANRQRA